MIQQGEKLNKSVFCVKIRSLSGLLLLCNMVLAQLQAVQMCLVSKACVLIQMRP